VKAQFHKVHDSGPMRLDITYSFSLRQHVAKRATFPVHPQTLQTASAWTGRGRGQRYIGRTGKACGFQVTVRAITTRAGLSLLIRGRPPAQNLVGPGTHQCVGLLPGVRMRNDRKRRWRRNGCCLAARSSWRARSRRAAAGALWLDGGRARARHLGLLGGDEFKSIRGSPSTSSTRRPTRI
jgi:hypothetical protein